MAQECAFFNAELSGEEYDRVYLAETFAAYFASFIGNGVYHGSLEELEVLDQDTPNMTVQVLSGQGWINGYWYRNTSAYTLSISAADGTLNRIDRIILRWDHEGRDIHLMVLRGTPSANPTPPAITRNSDYYDLVLANVTVAAGVTTITQSAIEDVRSDSTVCGWVTGVVEQIDLTNLYTQWTTFFNEFKKNYAEAFTTWSEEQQTEFEAWVATLHDILDEETAGHLQNEIAILQTKNEIFEVMAREQQCINGSIAKGIEWNVDELMTLVRAGKFDKFAIGDYITDTNTSIEFAIAAKNHYPAYAFGSGNTTKINHIVLVPFTGLATKYKFNNSATNSGGYAGSKMPANMETEYAKLSAKIRGYCVQTRIDENNKDVDTAAMRSMRLPTMMEITGDRGWASKDEFSNGVCGQLPLFRSTLFRILDNVAGTYWAADSSSFDTMGFCVITNSGGSGGSVATRNCLVRPLIVLA